MRNIRIFRIYYSATFFPTVSCCWLLPLLTDCDRKEHEINNPTFVTNNTTIFRTKLLPSPSLRFSIEHQSYQNTKTLYLDKYILKSTWTKSFLKLLILGNNKKFVSYIVLHVTVTIFHLVSKFNIPSTSSTVLARFDS